MPFIFGEVDATQKPDTAFPPSSRRVLLHDHAGTGFPSWVPLHDGATPRGIVSFNGEALEIVTGNENFGGTNAQFYTSAALSRLVRPRGYTHVYVEWEWAIRVFNHAATVYNFTKGVSLGIDTASHGTTAGSAPINANRTLALARCTIYDETAGGYRGGAWHLTTGDATAPANTQLTDKDGANISPIVAGYEPLEVGLNYGKTIRQYTEQVFKLDGAQSAILEGLRHNGVGFGSLYGSSGYDASIGTNAHANELVSQLPATSTDGGFQGGLNLMLQLDNRSSQPHGSKVLLYRVRAVAF